jgi:hypothetical protein
MPAFACADDASSRAEIVQLARSRAEAFHRCTFGTTATVPAMSADVPSPT